MLREELESLSVDKETCLSLYKQYLISVLKYDGAFEKSKSDVLSVILHDKFGMSWSEIECIYFECVNNIHSKVVDNFIA